MPDVPASFCINCGAHLEEGAHFCAACGHVRAGDPDAPPTPGEATPPPPTQVPPATQMPPTTQVPATGPVPVPVPPTPPATSGTSPLLIIAGVVAALVLVGAIIVIAIVLWPDSEASAEELVLEPIGYETPDPFTQSVTTGAETAPAANAVKVTPSGQNAGGQQVPGAQPGLYGGTKNNATCNPEGLITFLQANPDKAAAWAGVIGITTAEIPTYVRSLTPILLTRDTRVTNHGFKNGKATTIPAVLQAGTAVMVNKYGVPRVKCGCGNPLTDPAPVTSATKVKGTQWSGFSVPTTVVVTTTVEVNIFVLVDVTTGQIFERPPGSSGASDATPTAEELCAAFPTDPSCQATTTTTASTTTTTSPPVTVTPTAPPGGDVGDASGTAIGIVQSALSQCGQGGMLGSFSATEIDAWVYLVSVPITFEGFEDLGPVTASWIVDLNTANPQPVPQDQAAAELICQG